MEASRLLDSTKLGQSLPLPKPGMGEDKIKSFNLNQSIELNEGNQYLHTNWQQPLADLLEAISARPASYIHTTQARGPGGSKTCRLSI